MTTTMIASDSDGTERRWAAPVRRRSPSQKNGMRGEATSKMPAEERPDVPQVVTGALDEEDRPALLVPDLVLLVNGEDPLTHEESVAVEDRLLRSGGRRARSFSERRRGRLIGDSLLPATGAGGRLAAGAATASGAQQRPHRISCISPGPAGPDHTWGNEWFAA